MGGSNEFYDKFSVRYHLSVILKQLWQHPDHRLPSQQTLGKMLTFVRFVNMLFNDTTFLLDESLDALKAIHETQEAMKDTEAWSHKYDCHYECVIIYIVVVCSGEYVHRTTSSIVLVNFVLCVDLAQSK